VGRGPLARRLLAGSLDPAVDVAATLELRGYALDAPRARRRRERSRHDARFYATGAAVLTAAIAAELLGADGFTAYPTTELGIGPLTLALSALVLLSGLAPLSRKPRRVVQPSRADSPAIEPPPLEASRV
jgi:hypothetical protein